MPDITAVSGASGGLGRALVAELTTRGVQVRAGVRDPQKADPVAADGIEQVVCDLTDPASLLDLVDGADVVHHLAAWMGAPAGRAHAVNVEGTRNLLDAAAQQGVRRVVMASSVAVYGPLTQGHVTESWPRVRVGDAYGDSKIAAEEAAQSHPAVVNGELELVVLRPTMIYGPASNSWTLAPLAGIKRGVPVVIGSGEGLLDAVFVDDVARAFALAAAVEAAAGETLNVVGQAVSVERFFGAYAAMVNKGLRHLPLGVARVGATVAGAVTGALPMVDKVVPEMLTTMTSSATFDGTAAAEVLGFEATTGLEDGMFKTAAWLRQHGHISGPRSAMVVGAGRGLGRAVAESLARSYVKVYAADLPGAGDVAANPDVGGRGPRISAVLSVDATSEASLATAVAEIERREGHLDLTVTTVGGLRPGALEVQELAEIEAQLRLNAMAPLLVARAAAPGMRARGRGRIIAVGSTNGLLVTPFMGAYSAAKFALEAFSDALRLELLPFGVEVVLIQPGAMKTGFADAAKRGLAAEAERVGPPWAAYLQRLREADLWGEKGAADPQAVARTITAAAFVRRARSRVDATREVPFLKLFTKLPDALKDRAFIGPLKLGRGREKR